MSSLDQVYRDIFGERKPEKTELKCPVTGKNLWAEPTEIEVRDPSHFYFAEDHPEHRYERHPFSWNLFRKIHGGTRTMGSKALAYYRLEEDNTWTEMYYPKGLDKLVPKNTSQREIDLLIEIQELKRKNSELEYGKRISKGEPLLPKAMKVSAKTISSDLVPVQPMSEPKGLLTVLDTRYDGYKEIVYPYLVTDENIEEIKKTWNLEKYKNYPVHGEVKIGDLIDEWKHGGPLSMRAGECIIRDGVEIYSRLTKMS